MMLVNLLPERFGTVAPLGDTRQLGQEAAQAACALETPGMDVQDTRPPEGLEVPGLAQIAPFAPDAGTKAVRATLGFER